MNTAQSVWSQPAANGRAAQKPTRQLRASKRISLRQATNLIEAVKFAKLIGLPLVAHLTIHWAFTNVGDDGHHHPDYLREAAEAISQRPQLVRGMSL